VMRVTDIDLQGLSNQYSIAFEGFDGTDDAEKCVGALCIRQVKAEWFVCLFAKRPINTYRSLG
jgi:hypothetical protein